MQQSIICSTRFFVHPYIPKYRISALYPAEVFAGAFAVVQHGDPEEMCRHLHGITAEELESALSNLISIISFDSAAGWFEFLHASIPDFLTDPHRSGTFYVDQPKVNLHRAECCIKAICDSVFNVCS